MTTLTIEDFLNYIQIKMPDGEFRHLTQEEKDGTALIPGTSSIVGRHFPRSVTFNFDDDFEKKMIKDFNKMSSIIENSKPNEIIEVGRCSDCPFCIAKPTHSIYCSREWKDIPNIFIYKSTPK